MTLCSTSGSLGLPRYIPFIENKPIVEMWATWLDTTVLVHLWCCWSACRASVMLGDGCLHGVSPLHLCMVECAESSMVVGSLDEALTCCSLLACWKAWQAHLFTKVHVHHVHPFWMHCFLVCRWTCPSACAPLVHPVHRIAMFVGVFVPIVTHDRMTSNPKPPSIPWQMIISDVGHRERQQGCEAGWWLWALLMKTAQE